MASLWKPPFGTFVLKTEWKPSSSGYLHILALADNTIQQNNIKKCLPRDIQKKKECHRRTILGCVNDQKVSFSVKISPQLTGNILLLIAINTTLDLSQSSTVLKCLQRMINTLDTHRVWFSYFPLQNCEQRWAGISCSQSTELKIKVRGIEEKKIKQKIEENLFLLELWLCYHLAKVTRHNRLNPAHRRRRLWSFQTLRRTVLIEVKMPGLTLHLTQFPQVRPALNWPHTLRNWWKAAWNEPVMPGSFPVDARAGRSLYWVRGVLAHAACLLECVCAHICVWRSMPAGNNKD